MQGGVVAGTPTAKSAVQQAKFLLYEVPGLHRPSMSALVRLLASLTAVLVVVVVVAAAILAVRTPHATLSASPSLFLRTALSLVPLTIRFFVALRRSRVDGGARGTCTR